MSAPKVPEAIGHAEVLRLSWPILVSMLSLTTMTVASSIFVGRLGTTELAAIGVSASLIHAVTSLGVGLLGGMRVAIAKSWGARRQAHARRYAWQGIWLALGLGLVAVAFAPFGEPAFRAMGASPDVTPLAAAYYAIRAASSPLVFLQVALAAWFQARGDTRTPMMGAVLANVVNLALDPVLIFGLGPLPGLGVAGAAWATAAGLVAGSGVLIASAWRELGHRMEPLRLELLRPIVEVGLPKGVEHLLDVGSFVVFSSLLAHAGDAHLAAHVVGVRIGMTSFLPGFAIAEAAGVLVGQSLGAGRPDQARRAHRAATHLALGFMVLCGLLFLAVPEALVSIFGAEDEVRRLAVQVLLACALLQVFDAVATVGMGALTGAGDTRYVLVSTVGVAWLVKVPIAAWAVLHLGLGVGGAWMGVGAEIAVLAVLALARLRGDAWLARPVPEARPVLAA